MTDSSHMIDESEKMDIISKDPDSNINSVNVQSVITSQKSYTKKVMDSTSMNEGSSTNQVSTNMVGNRSITNNKDNMETQPKNNDNKSNSYFNKLQYNYRDAAPYIIMVQSNDKNLNNLHPISLGQILYETGDSGVVNIKKSGRNRIEVHFDSFHKANEFLKSDFDSIYETQSYIPRNYATVKGIIKGVPTYLTSEVLKNKLHTNENYEILEVYRYSKKETASDGKVTFRPIPTCKVTFRAQMLPRRVFLYFNSLLVDKYNEPIRQCFQCQGYGHLGKFCRNKVKCQKCGEEHNKTECANTVTKCANCKMAHMANSDQCTERKREESIMDKINELNISRFEAKKILSGTTTYAQIIQSKQSIEQDILKRNPFHVLTPPKQDPIPLSSSQALAPVPHKRKLTPKTYNDATDKRRITSEYNQIKIAPVGIQMFAQRESKSGRQSARQDKAETNSKFIGSTNQRLVSTGANNAEVELDSGSSTSYRRPSYASKVRGGLTDPQQSSITKLSYKIKAKINAIIEEIPDSHRKVLEELKRDLSLLEDISTTRGGQDTERQAVIPI